MRILLAIHNAYTDHTSGAALSMRILMQWLREAGHDVQVLATARFDAKPPTDLMKHLAEHEIFPVRSPPSKAFLRSVKRVSNLGPGRPTVDFTISNVPVRMLLTKAPRNTPGDRFEAEQFLFLLDEILSEGPPDVLVTYGGHPIVEETMRRGRAAGALVVFALHNYGYENRRRFDHVDHVYSCSPYLAAFYRDRIGLRSAALEPPLEWEDIEAPEDLRKFVTFVNPSLAKGAMLFARLADMLGSRRPDIPVLVVQSATSAGGLGALSGLDFGKYPNIMAAPATPRPSDFFALTRILLVPSAFHEPFGRVAAEALINGIPPLVSDRGALPDTVRGAGRVLPLPPWLTDKTKELPTVEEAQPWFDAVCGFWDDRSAYAEASDLARTTAERHYSEPAMRQRYVDYFGSLEAGQELFGEP